MLVGWDLIWKGKRRGMKLTPKTVETPAPQEKVLPEIPHVPLEDLRVKPVPRLRVSGVRSMVYEELR